MRLSDNALAGLSPSVTRFGYDRAAQAEGIVHLGIGAFHRAHQACYTDKAMDAGDRDWAVVGVSMRSDEVARQLNPQNGLFTLTERSGAGDATRLIGAVRRVLVASRDAAAVHAAIASPATGIVSLTVTEKGYCRAADGTLDPAAADDLSLYGLITAGLRARKRAGLAGLTLLSCDNLAHNGARLRALFQDYLDRTAPDLRPWFDSECRCPSTMVDRIVPATIETDRAGVKRSIGLRDEAAIFTEPFSQWVIEDRFVGARPRWEIAGAQLVSDVAPYESAKLRMLNGAHSALAYLGLGRGHRYVHEAIGDRAIRPVVEALMRREASPSVAPASGQNLSRYADDLLMRFANPALQHRLAQIAMDGSQKVPQRWLETLAWHQLHARQCPAILTALCAWLRHIRGDNGVVDDPRAVAMKAAWSHHGQAGIVGALFGPGKLVSDIWSPDENDRIFIERSLAG